MIRYAITPGDWATAGAALPGRCVWSDRTGQGLDRVRELAGAGVDAVLLREKHLPAAALVDLTRRLVLATAGTAMRVLVAGRPDVARSGGAAGVHLAAGPHELQPEQVRQVFAGAWVTISCHTLAEVERARRLAADAILFAPVFAKVVAGTPVQPGAGLELLCRAIERAGPVPLLALGGVTAENAPQCVAAGAAGVAGIRLFGLDRLHPKSHTEGPAR